MTELHPYPEYRDSGVSWLEGIPRKWGLSHGGAVLQQKQVKNRGMTESTVLSLSYGRIVVKPPEKLHGLVPESFETYQIVEPGNIIIRPIDLQNDMNTIRVGIARDRGIITSAYLCFGTREPLSADYAHLLLLGYDLKKVFYGMGSGLRQNLDWSDFKRLPVLLPSGKEQMAIVAYANQIDRRINRFIRNRRRLIGVLNEQKQAIINRAVTRGLETDVSLKPVENDQFDKIPAHWDISRVKYEFDCLDHRRVPLSSTERGKMTSRRYDYYGASSVIDKVDDYLFDDELLLLAEDGANLVLRNLPLAIIAKGKFWVNNHAHILKPKRGNIQYLAYLMEMIDYRPWITGAAQPKLTGDRLMRIWIIVPPVDEQKAIVEQIEFETASLKSAIDKAQREIDLIREYRTRLIADVVTGKLDVRHLAPETVEAAPEDLDEGLDDEMPEEDVAELVEEATDADD